MISIFSKKRYYGIWLLIFVGLIKFLFDSFPGICESIYGQVVYPTIRIICDFIVGLIPFPIAYIFLLACLIFFIRFISRLKNIRYSVLGKLLSIVNFWAWVIGLFYILWGFNYSRPNVKERTGMVNLSRTLIEKEALFDQSLRNIKELRYLNIGFSDRINEGLIDVYQSDQKRILESIGYSITSKPEVKRVYPNGILRRIGISGIYIPFTAQGNVDASLTNLEYPFIASHELSHANGITDEGEASFIAYLTCMESENDTVKYGAQIYLLRNLLFHIQHEDSVKHKSLLRKVPPKIKLDIRSIKENAAKYPDLFPNVSDQINDAYLKANGIESGSKSYGDLIDLIIEYNNIRN